MIKTPHYRLLLALPDGFADTAILRDAIEFFKTQDIPKSPTPLYVHDGCEGLDLLGLHTEELYGPANPDRLKAEIMRRGVSIRILLQNEGRLLAGSLEDSWQLACLRCDAVLAVGRSRKVEAIVRAAKATGKPVAHYQPTQVYIVAPPSERHLKRMLLVGDEGVTPDQAAKAYDVVSGYYGLFDVIFHDLSEPLIRHVPDLSIQLKFKADPPAVPEIAFSSVVVPLRGRPDWSGGGPVPIEDLPDISIDIFSGAGGGESKLLVGAGEDAWLQMLTLAPFALVVCIGSSDKIRFCGARAAGAHVPVVMLPEIDGVRR